MLYSRFVPVGAVMVTVPVTIEQDGCTVTLTVGAAGALGAPLTVTEVEEETQPVVVFLTVRL
jgi:hypothetical protein